MLRGLRHGGSPWLLRAGGREVVLRVARAGQAAEAKVAATRPGDDRPGLVHGDLWYGNTLWDDGRLTAVLDWDCAGVGPAGIDLGSLRCDAAWCHGVEAAGHILRGWEAEAAGPRATSPTGTPSRRSPPRRTWAGSRRRWPLRAAPT